MIIVYYTEFLRYRFETLSVIIFIIIVFLPNIHKNNVYCYFICTYTPVHKTILFLTLETNNVITAGDFEY